MRVHSNDQVTPHFPFLFGDKAANAMRKALELRYHLIPYIYSLGHHAFTDGAPIVRPLFMEFPADAKSWTISDQWLLGSGLMAAPVLTPMPNRSTTTRRDVYFPEGVWYEFNSTTAYTAGADGLTISIEVPFDGIPLFVRAGTILPLAPAGMQHTGQIGGCLDIHVYAGADASFTFVEDDGDTIKYETDRLAVRQTTFSWDNHARKLYSEVVGSFVDDSVFTTHQVRVFHPNGILPSDHPRMSFAVAGGLETVQQW